MLENGTVSLISPSDLSMSVYGHAADFCLLILYPDTLSNPLMASGSFLAPFYIFDVIFYIFFLSF